MRPFGWRIPSEQQDNIGALKQQQAKEWLKALQEEAF